MTRMFTDVFYLPSAGLARPNGKEKCSIALTNFYNWKLQVAWRADGASQKLIAPLWKNGSLLDHGKRNKIDFVGPSRAKRPIRIYLQTILQRFYASTILTQTPHCNSWTLAITWFFTFLSFSRIHFGLYDASNSQLTFPSILKLFKTSLIHSPKWNNLVSHKCFCLCKFLPRILFIYILIVYSSPLFFHL